MKITEKILWGLFVVSILLRLLRVPMYGFLTVISLSSLMLFYFWLSALLLPTPTRNDQKIVLSILVGIALSIGLTGNLYKLQAWPTAGFFLLLGLSMMFGALAFTLYLLGGNEPLAGYRSGLIRRLSLVIGLTMVIYAIPQRQMLAYSYPGESERVDLSMRLLQEDLNDSTRNGIYERLRELDEEKLRREYPRP